MGMEIRKNVLALVCLLTISGQAVADPHAVLEIDILGMTCPFCAYGSKKKIIKMPRVEEAQVSL